MSAIAVALTTLVWIFFFLAAVYVKQHSVSLMRMRGWLKEQHGLLEQDDLFTTEAHTIYNIYLPQIEDWIANDHPILVSTYIAQAIVGVYLFGVLTQQDLSVASLVLSVVIASTLVSLRVIRARRYAAEGICQQVLTTVQLLKNRQEQNES